ncbi:ABC transporter substrate-binding protein [Paenibacillus segetis]|uniref:Carbohydrate ABC transporter substrate-binding protein, CUT1 family n=1 Tax=Paenibacillus segetis TaxID=1325360 RepID=A0ABQ1Y6Y0_9BACL|nr:extracellular solute-binding protein [Paenibacillus segetis]GGH13641.1 hypothetical protein GCM10008013_06840 [Paenibacillus segetis]
MVHNKKISIVLILVLSIGLILTACGGNKDSDGGKNGPAAASDNNVGDNGASSQDPITLNAFLFNMDKRQALEETFKEFTKQNPGITVDLLVNDQDYYTVLKTKIASNDMPDIVMGEYGDLKELGDAGHILDLSGDDYINNYSQQIREQMQTTDGKIYGVPLDVSGMGIYYNKDLFSKAGIEQFPKTQQQLHEAIDKLKSANITPFALAVADGWTLAHSLFTTISGTTDDLKGLVTTVEGGGSIESDRLTEGFKTLDMMFANADPQASTNNYNASLSLLAQGKVAMLQQGYWALSSIKDINPDVNLGFAAIPYSNKEEDAKLGVNVNVSYAITTESKHQEAAKKLFAWLTTKEGNAIANEKMQQIPVIEGVEVSSNPIADDILAYKNEGKVVPWSQVLMNGSTRTEAESLMQSYYFNKKNAQEVMNSISASWGKK